MVGMVAGDESVETLKTVGEAVFDQPLQRPIYGRRRTNALAPYLLDQLVGAVRAPDTL